MPTPRPIEGLDMNRNFPAGVGHQHPWQRRPPAQRTRRSTRCPVMIVRPNICGFNAYHTSGVLLRPSSTKPDAKLDPSTVWVWLGEWVRR
ncbi:MAG: hypothetical protein R2697_01510 [Ilumatobacteraceae bacterium]